MDVRAATVNKRQRKKRHMGEFACLVLPVYCESPDPDAAINALIGEFDRALGMSVWNGQRGDVFLEGLPATIGAVRERAARWFPARLEFTSFRFGSVFDAWYGPDPEQWAFAP